MKNPNPAAQALASRAADDYGADLQRYLMRQLHHAHNARDLAQEVYLRLLRVGDAEKVRDPEAYLFRIASHVVYEFRMRARQSRVSFDSDAVDALAAQTPAETPNPEDQLGARQQLDRMLASLSPMCRTVFLLQKQEGLSYEEVAARLNIPEHAVQRYLFKALATLRAAPRGTE